MRREGKKKRVFLVPAIRSSLFGMICYQDHLWRRNDDRLPCKELLIYFETKRTFVLLKSLNFCSNTFRQFHVKATVKVAIVAQPIVLLLFLCLKTLGGTSIQCSNVIQSFQLFYSRGPPCLFVFGAIRKLQLISHGTSSKQCSILHTTQSFSRIEQEGMKRK